MERTNEDRELDPVESLSIIDAQRARVRDTTEIDGRIVFGGWGVAWLVGYLALHTTVRDTPAGPSPDGLGFAVFGLLLAGALVLTVVHISRRTGGLRGGSAVTGTLLGVAWFVAFATVFALMTAFSRTSVADSATGGVLANTIPCLVVGVMYMGQGAAWTDRRQVFLGVWICIVTAAGAFAGIPDLYLVMALAGGGGFLLAAAVDHLTRRGA